jgi:putative DNA primase/helicase
VCEGFATGATINEATDCTVVIAFDAGNLMPVAESVKKLYTGRKVVIAADNDQWGETNAGISKAEQASKNLSIPFIAPVFDDTTSKPTDFNDLAILQGHAEVARQLLTETPKIEAPQVAGVIDHLAHIAVETYEMQVNSKGKPLATIENFASIVKQLGVSIRYNEMSKEVEVKIPNLVSTTDNVTGVARAHLVSALNRVGFPIASLDEYILTLADANAYNPVCEWIESRPWDGVERITQLMKTVKLKSDSKLENGGSLSHLLMLRWMIGTVAAQYEPRGIMMKGVLVFVGAQSIGKTTWLKRLMPESLFSIKDGLILDPANKDSVKSAISHAIVELGEIDATFKRTDIAHLKAFITQDRDRIRLPYARTESNFPRRTVFFGSVNESNYLNDKTGNSRFWTIDVDTIDYMHGLDMQQVWAEVKERFYTPNCQAWHLTETELQALNARNASHEAIEPIHELITSSFNWGQIESTRKKMMNSTEICQAIGIQQPKKSDTGIASAYLRSLGVAKENGGAKRFYMPELV